MPKESFKVGDIVGITELSSERFKIVGFEANGHAICVDVDHPERGERRFEPAMLSPLPTRQGKKKLK